MPMPQTSSIPDSEGVKTRRKWRSVADKADAVVKLLHSFNWTLGEMLHIIFGTRDPLKDQSFTPSLTHVQMLSRFLKGQTKVSVGSVLDLFMSSKYGIPPTHDDERDLFFSLSTNYHAIHYARPAITSFAAQLVEAELIKEASRTVRKDGGLHTFTSARGSNALEASVNHGAESFSAANWIFRNKMPLAWDLLFSMACPSQQENSRDRRPPELVVTHALSCLAYSRNLYAKLVPLEKSLLNFACCANHYIYKYDSRVGIGSSYHSTYEALKKLAAHDAQEIRQLASSSDSALVLRLDNVQHYVRPRNFRVGREAKMKIGTAATVFVFRDLSDQAISIEDKKKHIAANRRKDLTFQQLEKMIDTKHFEEVCSLQWLRILVCFVPCLHQYKNQVTKMYKTECAKKILSPKKTLLYPLPTNGRNETVTKELLDALIDFLNEMGFSEDCPPKSLILTGGDGLTYERMVLLTLYMQFHDTPFQRLEWLHPFLETWHLSWTDLSRIVEAHWGSLTSHDPSTLGHSANRIKRKAPANLKKVDYYPFSELVYQVADARILDIWRSVKLSIVQFPS